MIKVRTMANNLTSLVNPNLPAVLRINKGYTVDHEGNQIPDFESRDILIQTQSLQSEEKEQLGLVDKQGEYITAYAHGAIHAIQRWQNRGASQVEFTPYGEADPVIWNVDKVLESYSTWVRLLLVRTT